MKIKKGDKVIILSGKDKGKEGKVLTAFPSEEKVVVEGVNKTKKHQKSRERGKPGEIIEVTMPIHVSKVALTEGGKPVRVGYKFVDGKKVRISKKSGKNI